MRAALLGFVSLAVAAGLPDIAIAQPGNGGANDLLKSAQLSFSIYALGTKGLDVVLDLQRENGTLQVETAMRTTGALNMLMRFESKAMVAALVRDDGLQPLRYILESDGRWSKRSVRMTWGPDGLPEAVIQPAPEPEEEAEREPVPDDLKRNTLDPTTAVATRALRGSAEPPCTGSDAIFDGRRRYNLHYQPVGPEELKAHNRSSYAGPAFRCTVWVEPVAGYTRSWMAENRDAEQRPTHLWLAQPPGSDLWLPVQIESSFTLGNSTGYITGAKLNGREWLEKLDPIRHELRQEITP